MVGGAPSTTAKSTLDRYYNNKNSKHPNGSGCSSEETKPSEDPANISEFFIVGQSDRLLEPTSPGLVPVMSTGHDTGG